MELLNEHNKLSQYRIAELLGVSNVSAYNWLNGITWPHNLDRLRKLSAICGLRMTIVFVNKEGVEYTF